MISENAKYNLTNITDEEEVYIKHFEDSLSVEKCINMDSINSICDIGSGAGFPSIPLKIKYPHLKVTIIEPTLKRCHFLEQLVLKLQLNHVIIRNERAESISELREHYDLVTARAVANLQILLELCIPYVKVNGMFVAMKGPSYQDELNQATKAIKELAVSVKEIIPYQLSKDLGTRHLICFSKNSKTNTKYPRNFQQIKRKPL